MELKKSLASSGLRSSPVCVLNLQWVGYILYSSFASRAQHLLEPDPSIEVMIFPHYFNVKV